jgi:hypothetical protein
MVCYKKYSGLDDGKMPKKGVDAKTKYERRKGAAFLLDLSCSCAFNL